MSSSAPVSVLLIGSTGQLGSALANALLSAPYAQQVRLTLLVRKATAETPGPKKDALDRYVAQGAKLVFGDIASSSEPELTKAFAGQQVIVSAVGGEPVADQTKIIPAAKAAHVRWLIPSEFAFDGVAVGRGSDVPGLDVKLDVLDAIKASGLDYTIVNTGGFAECVMSPFLGVDVENATVTAPGSFETVTTTTPLADIGRVVADAVVTGKGRNQTIYTGEPVTFKQIADTLERVTGKPIKRVVRSLADAEAAAAADPNDIPARFMIALAKQGKGLSWPTSQTYAVKNGLQHQPFQEFVQKQFGASK